MKNFVQPGRTLTFIAPYNVVSGQGFLVGGLFAVAAYDALSGAEVEGDVEGVFDFAKVSAQAWATVGIPIYWDNTAKLLTTVSAGNTFVGLSTSTAANPSTTGRVRLNGAGSIGSVGVPAAAIAVAAAGAANVSEVTITVQDAGGNTIPAVHHLDVYLSDDVDGQGLTGTTASGAVAAKAASGTDLSVFVAKKALRVQTLKTGVYILSITDTAKTAFKVCAVIGGKATVVATLITGNYG